MMTALIAGIIWGSFTSSMVQTSKAYCVCAKDNFKGAYCEQLKINRPQTCEVKK